MNILKKLTASALALTLAVALAIPAFAHGDDSSSSSDSKSSQNYSVTHEGTVVTVLREDGTPVTGGSVQVKTEANDPNSTLATETTDDNGSYDYGAYTADGAAILRISDGSTTIIYYLLTDTITYDSKTKDGSAQTATIDWVTVGYSVAATLAVVGVVTVINVKVRKKRDPEQGNQN